MTDTTYFQAPIEMKQKIGKISGTKFFPFSCRSTDDDVMTSIAMSHNDGAFLFVGDSMWMQGARVIKFVVCMA